MLITKRDNCIGIGKESARGTKVAPVLWIPLKSFDFEDKTEKVIDDSGYGIIEDSVDDIVVKQWAEGSIGGNVYSENFGLILYALLGTLSSGSVIDSSYTHSVSVQQGHQHQSLTISLDDALNENAYPLAMISTLEITAEVGGFVEYSAEFYSKVSESAGTITPSYTAEKPFTAKDVTLKLADDLSGLSGASVINVKTVKLTVEKDLEPDDILGSDDPNDILNKQVMVSGEIELLYEANTYKAYAQAGTNKAMRIAIISGDTIGAGSTPYSLTIDLAKVSFDWGKEIGDDLARQTLTFKGMYSLSDASMITASLVNATVSY